MSKKIYDFDFNPLFIFRVLWDEKNYTAILQFNRMSSERKLEPGEKDNFFTQLKEYCLKSRIGIEVQNI
jgi:hypothetical protein